MAAVSLAICGLPSFAHAQTATATAPALKAAFLYNFAKFATWPAEAMRPADPIVFCVLNDRAVFDQLVSLTEGRAIEGHPLVVRTTKADAAALAACRLLFVSGLDQTASLALLDAVAGKPVLTASDLESFAQSGGVAGFYVERGTLRFAINLEATQRTGLRLSSKLLSLAKIVKDERAAVRR